jgi:flagellar hook-length control protein FliK
MADIQSVSSAKFMHVASASKTSPKDDATDAAQHASFFGVLKSQLGKLDLPADGLVLELKAEGDENLLVAQTETDPAAAMMPAQAPSEAILVSDPTREAAVLSSVVSANAAPASDVAAPVNDVESDADLTQSVREAGVKSAGASRLDVLRRENAAANAAEAGQTLPLARPSAKTDAALIPAAVMAEGKAEGKAEAALSPALSTLTGLRPESGSFSPIALTHPFDQALRQAESKLNVAIEAPVRSPAFAAEVGDKVVWLAGRQGQLADFSLNPPQMGALEVRLTVSGGEATAQFFSPNPVVRDALDAAMPKLRELMAEAGLSLGETEVRDQAFSRKEGPQMPSQARSQDVEIVAHQGVLTGHGMARSSGLGLVDLYI